MNWQLIELADVAPTPWRNGGGTTRELCAWPDAQDWRWRVSVAEVASAGPFSHFPGVQRWLAILRGPGVRLRLDGRALELTPDSAPLAFAGDVAVSCELKDGPVQDLNLMVRGAAACRMRRVAGSLREAVGRPQTVALYNLGGVARIDVDGTPLEVAPAALAWRTLGVGSEIAIAADHAMWMEIAET
jgi:environmental stress-induced protein Ves